MPVSISSLTGKLRLLGLALGVIVTGHAVAREGLPTDRLIVKLRDSSTTTVQASALPTVSAAALDRFSSRIGVRLQPVRRTGTGAQVLRLPHAMRLADVQAYARKLQADPGVEYAVPDGIRKPTMLAPNDTYWSSQTDLFKGVGGIDILDAWDYTTGSTSINIAVIDTGYLNHPDLSGRILPGYDFISDIPTAGDGDGRDSDPTDPGDWVVAGQCYANSPAKSSSWHGTHVTGTLVANTNNRQGIAGINRNASVVPVRALGKCGGYDSDIIDGMLWANGISVAGVPDNLNPARILNLSLGGGPDSCSAPYQNAINQIVARKGIVVVAAGNDSGDAMQSVPGNCANVITVGAIGPTGNLASYSNTGSSVTIMAPGGDGYTGLTSTWNDGTKAAGNMTYGALMGTSMATPHVAGVVSLMLSLNPSLGYSDIVSKLRASATPFPAGSGCTTSTCGAGILNAAAAVQSVSPLIVSAGSNQSVAAGQAVTLSGSASYGAVTPSTGISYQWSQTSGATVTLTNSNQPKASFTAPGLSGTLGFQLRATDAYGNSGSSNVAITVVNGVPVLTVPGPQNVVAGNTASFTVSATGGASLAATGLPTGATFDASTGQFNWPSAGPVGTYTVQFTATNAQGSAAGSVSINVTAQLSSNSAPNTSGSNGDGSGSGSGSGSGGGGGCVLNPNAPFDPLLPALLTGALLAQVRRLRRKNRH